MRAVSFCGWITFPGVLCFSLGVSLQLKTLLGPVMLIADASALCRESLMAAQHGHICTTVHPVLTGGNCFLSFSKAVFSTMYLLRVLLLPLQASDFLPVAMTSIHQIRLWTNLFSFRSQLSTSHRSKEIIHYVFQVLCSVQVDNLTSMYFIHFSITHGS